MSFRWLSIFLAAILSTSTALLCPRIGKDKLRVRRECRTLTSKERQDVADAIWVMRNVTTKEGQKKYGKDFISYDDLVLIHSCSISDPRCDQGHFSPLFIFFHRVYLMVFENSLLAINSDINAVPYWNMAYDAKGGKYYGDKEMSIFSKNFFGMFEGDKDKEYAVTDGLFANFPISKYDQAEHGPESDHPSQCVKEGWIPFRKSSVCEECCGKSDCTCKTSDTYPTYLRTTFDSCSPTLARTAKDFPLYDGTADILFTEDDFNACTDPTKISSIIQWERCVEFQRSTCTPEYQQQLSRLSHLRAMMRSKLIRYPILHWRIKHVL